MDNLNEEQFSMDIGRLSHAAQVVEAMLTACNTCQPEHVEMYCYLLVSASKKFNSMVDEFNRRYLMGIELKKTEPGNSEKRQ